METGAVERTGVVAWTTFRSAFAGGRGIGLVFAAAVYPILVLAIDLAKFSGLDLLATSETLFSTLFLPVILLLVCLVLGVGAFRGELEEDTLVYPLNRTIPRPAIAAGKFLGTFVAAVAILLPSALLGMGLASALGTGPTTTTSGLEEAVVVVPLLAILAYEAIFFLLGLATAQALIVGLLYGFLWETFISLIAGPIRELSVVYYLRGVGEYLVPGGNLGAGVGGLDPTGVTVGAILLAVGSVVGAALLLRYVEIRPAPAPT